MLFRYDCVDFNGYKPCRHKRLCENCHEYRPRGKQILIINLGALGDVARTTALLPAVLRVHPDAQITWLTSGAGTHILQHIKSIHEVLPFTWETCEALKCREFDLVLNVDKEKATGALVEQLNAKEKRGFTIGKYGEIRYLNAEAAENYAFGLDDRSKFFLTTKSELQVLCETMAIPYARDSYQLTLADAEIHEAQSAKAQVLNQTKAAKIVGFNTGCSHLYSYKKLTVEDSIRLVAKVLKARSDLAVVLLGGREDTARNQAIAAAFQGESRVYLSPTEGGIRQGMVWVEVCDVVVSGDSFGMHLAIGLKKPTVAWFGLSVPTEIEFFDRGEALVAQVPCAPCWRRACNKPIKCFEQVDIQALAAAVVRWVP